MRESESTCLPPLLEMQHVSVRRDGNTLLDIEALDIKQGCHTAILGANGSGKSTLVKLIERQLYPLARLDDGRRMRLRLFGQEHWQVSQLRRHLGVVSSERQRALADDAARLRAFDVVVSGFFASHGLALDVQADAEQQAAAWRALSLMGAEHLAMRSLQSLSTGEARRVLIARALVHRPRALLLDEPTSGLDMVARQQFLQRLRALAQAGTSLILVTHHVEEILPEIERVVMLREGRVMADGDKATLLQDAPLGKLFAGAVAVQRNGDWYQARLQVTR